VSKLGHVPKSGELIGEIKALLISDNRKCAIVLPEDSLETVRAKYDEVKSSKPRTRLRPN
jgi:hypothetical protein